MTAITQLREEILYHIDLYHRLDEPVISDAHYDALYKKLVEMEATDPDPIPENSPTRLVGGMVSSQFTPVKLEVPMLSLGNSFTDEDVANFHDLVVASVGNANEVQYYVDVKYDGLAINLRYFSGWLVQACTRGDGSTGEDVTVNVTMIDSVPKYIPSLPAGSVFEARGEIVMTKDVFRRINDARALNGEKLFVNPRNAAAGSLRAKDPTVTQERQLQFFAYGIGAVKDVGKEIFDISSYSTMMRDLKRLGMPVSQYYYTANNPIALSIIYNKLMRFRKDIEFDIDGVVYKLDQKDQRDKMGFISRSPRWATAHKFPPEEAMTLVEAIDIQVGRTGALTPVARLKPVFVGGVTVTNATLHNGDEIIKKDVRVGDTVLVRRAGDVVPELLHSLPLYRPVDSVPYQMPTHCPSCGGIAARDEDKAVLRCTNNWILCDAQRKEGLIHFVGRSGMNIDGLGDVGVEKLVDLGWVKTPLDIMTIPRNALVNVFGEKTGYKISNSIDTSRQTTMEKFLFAFGIRHVGQGTSKRLTAHYRSMLRFLGATEAELMSIEDIGPITVKSIMAFLTNPLTLNNFKETILHGDIEFEPVVEKIITGGYHLEGKTVVITGSFGSITRDMLAAKLESMGVNIGKDVSKKTDACFVGEKPGGNAKKAAALNIPIYGQDEVDQLYKVIER